MQAQQAAPEKSSRPIHQEATRALSAIREGNVAVLEQLYALHYQPFQAWAGRRFHATPGDIKDAWQEAVSAFYMKVMEGKLMEMYCSIPTFLYTLGHFWLANNHRKLKRIWWTDETDKYIRESGTSEGAFWEDDIWEEEKILLRAAMQRLSDKCREMLVKRHFEAYKIEEIMHAFDYTSKNSTSASLATCLKDLKDLILKLRRT